jgi:hypothetical protein
VNKEEKRKPRRYSISVTGRFYERLRTQVTSESVASFVDDVIATTLEDPALSAQVVDACLQAEGS